MDMNEICSLNPDFFLVFLQLFVHGIPFCEPAPHVELQGWVHTVDVGDSAEKSEQSSRKEFVLGADCCKALHGLFVLSTRCNCSVLQDINLFSYR